MLPPSVISMEGPESQLVLARGIGVMSVGQGWVMFVTEYGLSKSDSLLEQPFQQQYAISARINMSRIPPNTQETTTTARREESLQLKPPYPNEHAWHVFPTALWPLGQALQLELE